MDTTFGSVTAQDSTAWPLVGSLLDALTQRDFSRMKTLFAPDIRFRAMIPPGPFELDTADETAARFGAWFGGDDAFEVVDASLGQVGSKLYARWLVRMTSADDPKESRIAEQHVFTSGTERIETLDLLCSGFQRGTR